MGFPIEPETKNSGGTGAGQPAVERSTEGVASLLAVARQRITEGNPSLALQAIMMALHATGGEQAVFAALNRARETYHNGSGPSVETDELSALFAEFAISTLPPRPVQAVPEPVVEAPEEMDDSETNEDSILAESGRQQVIVDASSDGSSFVCQQCGGLVSNLRRDEHFTYWCSPPLSN